MEYKVNLIKHLPKQTINNIIKNESFNFKLGYNNPYDNTNNNYEFIVGQIVAIEENKKKTTEILQIMQSLPTI